MKRGPTVPPGARWVPTGPEGLWGRRGVPKGSEHQLCTKTGQSGDPSDDYKPRAALEGTLFFSAKTDMPPQMAHFLV